MIIFGTRSKVLKKMVAVEHSCVSCSNTSHAAVGVGKYFHIFWIPVLMFSKKVILQCGHCRKVTPYNELMPNERPVVPEGLFALKHTWHLFFAIFAFLFLIALSVVLSFFTWIGGLIF